MISRLFGTDKLIDMLATPSFWFTLVILIGFIVLLVACLKNPKIGKWVFLVIFCLAWVGLSAYSGVQLNYYYNTSGGIFGQLTGIFNNNEVQIKDNLVFEFKNIELTKSADNTYSATISLNEILSIDSDQVGVYINDMPCSYVENNSDYVIAKYSYSFLDNDMSILCTDTLTLNFAFYNNLTQLTVSTNGGSTAVKFWNYYFIKNNFNVRIGESDYNYSSDLEFGTGDISNYVIVTFVNREETIYQVYKIGSKVDLPVITDEKFLGWSYENSIIDNSFIVNSSITLIAIYDEVSVVVSSNGIFNYIYGEITDTVTPSGGMFSTAILNLVASSNDLITIYPSKGSLIIESVTTDGDYNITENSDNNYTISWTNATSVVISLNWSGVSGL